MPAHRPQDAGRSDLTGDKSNSLSKQSAGSSSWSESCTSSLVLIPAASDRPGVSNSYQILFPAAARNSRDAGDNPGTIPSATTGSDTPPASDQFGRDTSNNRRPCS